MSRPSLQLHLPLSQQWLDGQGLSAQERGAGAVTVFAEGGGVWGGEPASILQQGAGWGGGEAGGGHPAYGGGARGAGGEAAGEGQAAGVWEGGGGGPPGGEGEQPGLESEGGDWPAEGAASAGAVWAPAFGGREQTAVSTCLLPPLSDCALFSVCCIFFSSVTKYCLWPLSDCAVSSLLHLFLSPVWQSTVFGLCLTVLCQVCCIFFCLLCDKVLSLASLSDCALSCLLHLFLSSVTKYWLWALCLITTFHVCCIFFSPLWQSTSLASVWLRLFMSAASFSLFCDKVLRLLLLIDNFCMVLFCGVLLLYGAILWCTVFGPSDCTFSCLTASFLLCDKVLLLLITIDNFCIVLFSGVLSLAAFFHVCSIFYSLLCDSAKFGMFDLCELETSTFENGNTDCGLEWVGLKSFLLFTQLNLAETWMFAFSKNLRGQGPLSYSYMCPLIWSWSEVKVTGAQFHGELPCVHVEN